eukprot:848871-Rhodomonas_salina.1
MYDVAEELTCDGPMVLGQLEEVLSLLEGPDGAGEPVASLVITDGGSPESWARRQLLAKLNVIPSSLDHPKRLLWEMCCCAHAYNLLTGGIVDSLWKSLAEACNALMHFILQHHTVKAVWL